MATNLAVKSDTIAAPPKAKPHILLVEDNSADANLLFDLIGEYDNAPSLSWVLDGYEALEYLMQRGPYAAAARPDMILLDLGLPRIHGHEVLRQLREHPDFADIPAVVLTMSRNPLDREQCASLGAKCYVPKPVNLEDYETLAKQIVDGELIKTSLFSLSGLLRRKKPKA